MVAKRVALGGRHVDHLTERAPPRVRVDQRNVRVVRADQHHGERSVGGENEVHQAGQRERAPAVDDAGQLIADTHEPRHQCVEILQARLVDVDVEGDECVERRDRLAEVGADRLLQGPLGPAIRTPTREQLGGLLLQSAALSPPAAQTGLERVERRTRNSKESEQCACPMRELALRRRREHIR